jgi:tetratricopeptide (TPR) repeat protein
MLPRISAFIQPKNRGLDDPFRSPSSNFVPLVLATAILAGVGCSKKDAGQAGDSASASTGATATSSQEAVLMDSGTTILYTNKDPNRAAGYFARVHQANPKHYGAHYQMAVALDSSGRVNEAKEAWQLFLPMAQAANDTASAGKAQRRISAPQGAMTDAQLMNSALYLLYTAGDAAGAETQLREILNRNANHYGANYQLATALDKQNKAADARPLWQKVLKMAQDVKDSATIAAAQARLARNP